ncbi:MAG: S-layer homology domain-containing protein [Clostridiales bacterium]|nr:S-layer homology domain-containing protein [Clostridiales bacterium]MCD8223492.1 S-layer homology domain-containing protein [Clostridiales bacterium]
MMQRQIAGTLAVALAVTAVPMVSQAADNNQDYRRKVVGVAGIMYVGTGLNEQVTRGEFAQMLVNASTYKDYLPTSSSVSVYSDVPSTHEYASSIRIAAEQNWMVGYLGGLFKPDQAVTLQEAVRGVLALLGYTTSDFTGNTSASRMALYYSLEMNDELNREPNEVLNRTDCINLFYNLLKTDNKSGVAYATVLGASLNSDGEVNPMDLADTELKGPKLIPKGHQLGNYVPFNVQEASIFVQGEASSYDLLKSHIADGYVVIYYNTNARTIWAYLTDEDVQTGRCAVRGTVENIYYSSADVMTPTSITLDGDSVEYELSNSEMQFAFSIYGSLRVGDTVTIICEKTTNSSSDETYSVIDYVED